MYDKAKIMDFSRVEKDAKVYGNARVVDGALISERAQVYGHALIELSVIAGDAHVCGYAHCSGCSTVNQIMNKRVRNHPLLFFTTLHF